MRQEEALNLDNTFIEYLCSFIWFDRKRIMQIVRTYLMGATDQREPVFWHIREDGTFTDGHIYTMDADSGKVYDESWYYHDSQPVCLFGQHLLALFPDKPVALTGSEMTAAVMSSFSPAYLWLAAGKKDICVSDLSCLKGRNVTLFPDRDDYEGCLRLASAVKGMNLFVSRIMEDRHDGCLSIADVMLSAMPKRPSEEEAALYNLENGNSAIALLVRNLGLEAVRIEKDEDVGEENRGGVKTAEDAWHGQNRECHSCRFSHESINGTYCTQLKKKVEYGKPEDCHVQEAEDRDES
jgi:hypothetical protein